MFRKHIEIAEKAGKPILIHCVRAFNELIRIKKDIKPKVPFILHGFNANRETAIQLINHGMFLSFGHALLDHRSNAAKVIGEIPTDRVFLETDDSDLMIEEIYDAAATLLSLEKNELIKIIFKNIKKIFPSV